MPRRRQMSVRSMFAYTGKVAANLAPIVGEEYARVLANVMAGEWQAATRVFLDRANNIAEVIARTLSGRDDITEANGMTNYRAMAVSLAAMLAKSYYRKGIVGEEDVPAVAWKLKYVYHVPSDVAEELARKVVEAFNTAAGSSA